MKLRHYKEQKEEMNKDNGEEERENNLKKEVEWVEGRTRRKGRDSKKAKQEEKRRD